MSIQASRVALVRTRWVCLEIVGWWWAEDVTVPVFMFWLSQETREVLEAAHQSREEPEEG